MKYIKATILSLIIAGSSSHFAQDIESDSKNSNTIFMLESQFYPRFNTGVFEANIKSRILFSDVHVLRSNWALNYYDNKREILESNGDGVGTVEILNQLYNFTIGYEYLFKKERLSPYLGFELITGFGKNEEYGSRTDSVIFISDFNYSVNTPLNQIGFGVFSGFDFIIVDGLYLGTEIGLQYLATNYKRGEIKTLDASSSTASETTIPISSSTEKRLGASGAGVVRIGWRF